MNPILIAAVFGFLAVALGAFGAHALKPYLDEYAKGIWQTAVFYHFIHSLAILAAGILAKIKPELKVKFICFSFITGIFLFSGSLYLLALTDLKWLGMVTPIGGLAFLTGWGLLAWKSTRI